MTPDQERWAEALAVVKMHGARAEAFIAERCLALIDDNAGLARWREIGDRVKMLREAEAQGRN